MRYIDVLVAMSPFLGFGKRSRRYGPLTTTRNFALTSKPTDISNCLLNDFTTPQDYGSTSNPLTRNNLISITLRHVSHHLRIQPRARTRA